MPIKNKNWSTATRSHVREIVPEKPGIYELKSFGELVYIGKDGRNLQRRILEHISARNPNKFRYKKVTGFFASPKKEEDKHLTKYGSTDDEMPPWNKADTRD